VNECKGAEGGAFLLSFGKSSTNIVLVRGCALLLLRFGGFRVSDGCYDDVVCVMEDFY